MKLRTKILMVAILPMVILGVVTYIIASNKITSSMKLVIENNLESVAIAAKDTLSSKSTDKFRMDSDGTMWSGTYNVTKDVQMADNIKDSTGIDVTIFMGDTRCMTTVKDDKGNRVLGTKAGDKVIQKVINGGEDYFAENVDVQGIPYFAYYTPVYENGSSNPAGMVFAGMSQVEVERQINTILFLMVAVILVVIILTTIIVYILVNRITGRIHNGIEKVSRVAAGDLLVDEKTTVIKSKDETAMLLNKVSELQNELRDIVSEIAEKSETIKAASEELKSTTADTLRTVEQVEHAVSDISEGASSQADETQQATEHVIVMGDMLQENDRSVKELSRCAEGMRTLADTAARTLSELDDVNRRSGDAINIIYEQTNMTHESAEKIRQATSLIASIAEETNLLSLNASIEAARAGEAGRGFAVVAGQIQKLAEQSNASTQQIEQIITMLISDSEKSVQTMEDVKVIMKQQTEMVDKTDVIFKRVIDGIGESIDGVNVIAQRTSEIDKARVNVVDIVQNLTAIAEENAAATEQTSASVAEVTTIINGITKNAEDLNRISDELHKSIDIFNLE